MQPAPATGGIAVRRTNFMLAVKDGENACATLARLGLDVAAP